MRSQPPKLWPGCSRLGVVELESLLGDLTPNSAKDTALLQPSLLDPGTLKRIIRVSIINIYRTFTLCWGQKF